MTEIASLIGRHGAGLIHCFAELSWFGMLIFGAIVSFALWLHYKVKVRKYERDEKIARYRYANKSADKRNN